MRKRIKTNHASPRPVGRTVAHGGPELAAALWIATIAQPRRHWGFRGLLRSRCSAAWGIEGGGVECALVTTVLRDTRAAPAGVWGPCFAPLAVDSRLMGLGV